MHKAMHRVKAYPEILVDIADKHGIIDVRKARTSMMAESIMAQAIDDGLVPMTLRFAGSTYTAYDPRVLKKTLEYMRSRGVLVQGVGFCEYNLYLPWMNKWYTMAPSQIIEGAKKMMQTEAREVFSADAIPSVATG